MNGSEGVTSGEEYITVQIGEVVVSERFGRELGDLTGLEESIRASGILEPILVTRELRLICGARRLEAAREAGFERTPARILDLADVRRAEVDENVHRFAFSAFEIVAIHDHLAEGDLAKARERQREGGRAGGGGGGPRGSGKLPEALEGDARERIVGLSRRSLDKTLAVIEAARGAPKRSGPIAEAVDRTGNVDRVYRAVRALKREGSARSRTRIGAPGQKESATSVRSVALPHGPFGAVVVGPGWLEWREAGHDVAAEVPVADVAAPVFVLAVWTRNAAVAEAVDLVRP